MLDLEAVVQLIWSQTIPVPPEPVELYQAGGRVLRQHVATKTDLPAFTRSAMDGYAISHQDPSTSFDIVEVIRAGALPTRAIQSGECARIFTGSQLPQGADQVIPQELAQIKGEKVTFRERPAASSVRQQGEDAQAGQILVQPGVCLRPIEMGTLAMLGVAKPIVSRLVRVAHVATGDELVAVELPLQGSQIHDSNSPLVRSFLASPPFFLVSQDRVADNYDATLQLTRRVLESEVDVLLISGGASVGDHDHAAKVLEALGFTLHFRAVNLRPGKPLIFATKGEQLAFAIPGNPVSHLVCLQLIIQPALEHLAGLKPISRWLVGQLEKDFAYSPNDRETFWPAKWSVADQQIMLNPLPWQSSGHLSSLVSANALLRLPSKSGPFVQGQSLGFLMI